MTCTLIISDGSRVLIDKDDYDRVASYTWYLHTGYPARNIPKTNNKKRKTLFMHHFICKTTEVVDHINGNRLDNRKANLRIVSIQENNFNRRPNHEKESSKFKGVFWSKEKQLWLSIIKINGASKHLGYFSSEQIAAAAYNENAKILFREFAYLNDVPEKEQWWRHRVFSRYNSTGFRGVTEPTPGKWQARITVKGKRLSLGYYDSPEEAATAYNKAAIEFHQDRALLNKF